MALGQCNVYQGADVPGGGEVDEQTMTVIMAPTVVVATSLLSWPSCANRIYI